MKIQKPVGLSKQSLQDGLNKKVVNPSYSNIIKIPLADQSSAISREITKKLLALTGSKGLALVENRMPLRLLLNNANDDFNKNALSILSSLYKKEIYRINLSQFANHFTGETEKNLDEIFKKAEEKNWILLFDEADAVFGKRTEVHDSHDKYANQEVSYLLKRLESYNGILVIKCLSQECSKLSSLYHFKTFS